MKAAIRPATAAHAFLAVLAPRIGAFRRFRDCFRERGSEDSLVVEPATGTQRGSPAVDASDPAASGAPPSRGSTVAMRALVVLLIALATFRLGAGYRRLLVVEPAVRSSEGHIAIGDGAVDLMARRFEMDNFFHEAKLVELVYPPATYAMLWPLVGWNGVTAARWTWAATSTLALGWICWACARCGGFRAPLARLAFGLLPAALFATSAAFSVGQVTVVVLALLVAGVLRLARPSRSRRHDALTGALFALAAAKPSLAAPFAWLLLFVPQSLRPLGFAISLYAGLTGAALTGRLLVGPPGGMAAVSAHYLGIGEARAPGAGDAAGTPTPPSAGAPPMNLAPGTNRSLPMASPDARELVDPAVRRAKEMFDGGSANLQNLLLGWGVGLPYLWLPPIVAILAFGLWAWPHRCDDPWILLGVSGLVARLAFYHRVFDDMLVIPAFVALARVGTRSSAKSVPRSVSRGAFAVLVAQAVAMTVPVVTYSYIGNYRLIMAGCWVAGLLVLLLAVRPGSAPSTGSAR